MPSTGRPPTGPRPATAQQARLTGAFPTTDGKPRFTMVLPPGTLKDPGVQALVRGETERGGYEYPTRAFIDAHLGAGDLFIDVGAHWGIYALHAATRHRGGVRVLAIEAHPGNIGPLSQGVTANGLGASVEIICAAAGARPGSAPLVFNSTMGHSLHGLGLPEGAGRLGQITVPVLPLDLLLAERPELAERRILLKVDVEGYEPEVMEGARATLDTGRVAAVIWEHGSAFRSGERREAMMAMCAALEARGYRQFRFPHPTMGGPLVPFAPTPECYNVFALAPDLKRSTVYDKPRRRPEPVPVLERAPDDPETRASTTEMLIATKTTDAARWADFEALREGAEERAASVAGLIEPGSRVLDIGAGVMALRDTPPPGCTYVPADLLPFDPATVVVDLNDGGFPEGAYDVTVMLDVLEFVHDVDRLLRRAAGAAPRLIVSYRPAQSLSARGRRARGYVNDHTQAEFEALLDATGWWRRNRTETRDFHLFECRIGS
jgi:FkbM family methyltransferase